MGRDDEISEYLDLSRIYLEAAKLNFENDLLEPSLFNSIHALELGIKSLLMTRIEGRVTTHNVGGLLGRYFRKEMGVETCRNINRILMRYNLPRYPGVEEYQKDDILETIELIDGFLSNAMGIIDKDQTCGTDLSQSTSEM